MLCSFNKNLCLYNNTVYIHAILQPIYIIQYDVDNLWCSNEIIWCRRCANDNRLQYTENNNIIATDIVMDERKGHRRRSNRWGAAGYFSPNRRCRMDTFFFFGGGGGGVDFFTSCRHCVPEAYNTLGRPNGPKPIYWIGS